MVQYFFPIVPLDHLTQALLSQTQQPYSMLLAVPVGQHKNEQAIMAKITILAARFMSVVPFFVDRNC